MGTLNTPRSKRQAYRVRIENQTSRVRVVADLPETFGFSVHSSFDNLSSLASPAIVNDVLRLGGGSLMLQPFTKRIWTGTTPIQIPLSLIFDAETNAKQDVHDVAITLQALCLPIGVDSGVDTTSWPLSVGGNTAILLPPNPTLLDSDRNRTAIWIGNMFYFHSVSIENVQYQAESRFASDGYPIAGQIDITVETDYVYSRQNLMTAAGVSTE